MDIDRGSYTICCVKAGGHTLTGYGQYAFSEGEEINLLSLDTPPSLRCGGFGIATNVCTNPALEIAQLINSGDFEVKEMRRAPLPKPPQR